MVRPQDETLGAAVLRQARESGEDLATTMMRLARRAADEHRARTEAQGADAESHAKADDVPSVCDTDVTDDDAPAAQALEAVSVSHRAERKEVER